MLREKLVKNVVVSSQAGVRRNNPQIVLSQRVGMVRYGSLTSLVPRRMRRAAFRLLDLDRADLLTGKAASCSGGKRNGQAVANCSVGYATCRALANLKGSRTPYLMSRYVRNLRVYTREFRT